MPSQPIKRRDPRKEAKVAHIVQRKIRYGRAVQLDQIGSVPESAAERELFVSEFKKIRLQRRKMKNGKDNATHAALDKLRTKARVLYLSKMLTDPKTKRLPTSTQLIAYLVRMQVPWNEVHETMLSMLRVERNEPKLATWIGSTSRLNAILRDINGVPMISRIEQILRSHPETEMNGESILRDLGIKKGKNDLTYVNACLQVLELGGFVRKHSVTVDEDRKRSYAWVHARYRNPIPKRPGAALTILQALSQKEPVLSTSLYRPGDVKHQSGNPDAAFSSAPMLIAMHQLEESGLIHLDKVRVRKTIHGRTGFADLIEIKRTALGKKLMDRMNESGKMPELLRKLTLGERKKDKGKSNHSA